MKNNNKDKTPWLTIAACFIVPWLVIGTMWELSTFYRPASVSQQVTTILASAGSTTGPAVASGAASGIASGAPSAIRNTSSPVTGKSEAPAPMLASQLYALVDQNPRSIEVMAFVPGQNACAVSFTNGSKALVQLPDGSAEDLRARALKANIAFAAMPKAQPKDSSNSSTGTLMVISALIIAAGMIAGNVIVSRSMKKPPGKKAIGKDVKSLREGKRLTWDDIGGCAEAVRHFKRVARWTQKREFYRKHKARMPKGLLLKGPPGTGKTLLLRILCNMLDGDGICISGSDLVEMFVGVGAARVREIFAPARAYVRATGKPYIIGIDEIDAVGGAIRAAPGAQKHEEREQTLNALLVELDGVLKEEGIIVVGMTNRFDMLDPALVRPGRLEYHIEVGLPDIAGREQILTVHMAGKKIAPDATPARIAKETYGMSGADLELIANTAAICAADRSIKAHEEAHPQEAVVPEKKKQWSPFGDPAPAQPERKEVTNIEISEITYADIDKAIVDLLLGEMLDSKKVTMRKRDKVETVTHEVGHAVTQSIFPWYDPITIVSAQPRTKTLGVVVTMPDHDKVSLDKRTALSRIVTLMAGRCAQVEHLGTEDAGVAMDYQMATDLARDMVMRYGLGLTPLAKNQWRKDGLESWIPKLSVGNRQNGSKVEVSQWLQAELDRAWLQIIRQCEETATYIIRTEKARMQRGIEELSAKETIPGRDWRTLMENTPSAVHWTELPLFREFKKQDDRLDLSQQPKSWWQIFRRR